MLLQLVGSGFVFACPTFGRHFLKMGAEMSFARRRSVAAKQKRNMDLSRDGRTTLFCSFGQWQDSCECIFFAPDLTLVKNECSCNLDLVI